MIFFLLRSLLVPVWSLKIVPLIKLITKRGINFIMIQYITVTRYILVDSIYAYKWAGIGRMSRQVWYGLVVAKIPRTNAPLFHIIQFNVRTMRVHGHLRDWYTIILVGIRYIHYNNIL